MPRKDTNIVIKTLPYQRRKQPSKSNQQSQSPIQVSQNTKLHAKQYNSSQQSTKRSESNNNNTEQNAQGTMKVQPKQTFQSSSQSFSKRNTFVQQHKVEIVEVKRVQKHEKQYQSKTNVEQNIDSVIITNHHINNQHVSQLNMISEFSHIQHSQSQQQQSLSLNLTSVDKYSAQKQRHQKQQQILSEGQPQNKLSEQRQQQYLKKIKDLKQQYCLLKKEFRESGVKLLQYENILKEQRENSQIERKANEVYSDFYSDLCAVYVKNQNTAAKTENDEANVQVENIVDMDKIVHKFQQLFKQVKLLSVQSKQKNSSQNVHSSHTAYGSGSGNNFNPNQNPLPQPPRQYNFNNQEQLQKFYQSKIKSLNKSIADYEQKVYQLRQQLMKSTQNNIDVIFNKEISASCCLEQQLQKITKEMTALKENMKAMTNHHQNQLQYQYDNGGHQRQPQQQQYNQRSPFFYHPQPHFVILPSSNSHSNSPHSHSTKAPEKVIKIYTTKESQNISQVDSDQQQVDKYIKRGRYKSQSKNQRKRSKRRSVSSSSSGRSKGSSAFNYQQNVKIAQEMSKLKNSYNQIKAQFSSFVSALSNLTSQQQTYKEFFSQMRAQLESSYKERISQIDKERRFEMNQILNKQFQQIQNQRRRDHDIIKNLDSKVRDLTSKMNVPERLLPESFLLPKGPYNNNFEAAAISFTNTQQNIPLSNISISVEHLRQIQKLRKKNNKFEYELQKLKQQTQQLQRQLELERFHKNRLLKSSNRNNNNSHHYNHRQQQYNDNKPERCSKQQQQQSNSHLPQNYQYQAIQEEAGQSIIYDLKNLVSQKTNNLNNTFSNNTFIKKQFQQMPNYEPQQLVGTSVCASGASDRNSKYFTNNNLKAHAINYQQHSKSNNNFLNIFNSSRDQRNLQNNYKVILFEKERQNKQLQRQNKLLSVRIQQTLSALQVKEHEIQELEVYVADLESKSIELNSMENSQSKSNRAGSSHLSQQNNQQTHNNMKVKYENYIKNLKMIIKQIKRENQSLKQSNSRIIYGSPTDQINTQEDPVGNPTLMMKSSGTHSDKTTKNIPVSTMSSTVNHTINQISATKYQQIQPYVRKKPNLNSTANNFETAPIDNKLLANQNNKNPHQTY